MELNRLANRLKIKADITEEVYSLLSKIDAVKQSWSITGKLLPQMLDRLTHSVIIA